MADLLEADFGLAEKNTLYRCLDKLVKHKDGKRSANDTLAALIAVC
jgi:hypothetical protein